MSEQKVAIVTGCSSGVGLHTATRLAEQGWSVVATMRDTAKANALQAECAALLRQKLPAAKEIDVRLGVHQRKPQPLGEIGVISSVTKAFCGDCNRVRVSAEGQLLLCLGQEHSSDLRRVLRAHPGDGERLRQAIVEAMQFKPKGHDFNLKAQPVILRHMNMTGG